MKLVARGGTWQVHFQDANGERQRVSTQVKVDETLPDKGKARANLAGIDKMRAVLMGAVPADVRAQAGKKRTLAQALRYTLDPLWEKKKARRSFRYRVDALVKEVGWWRLSDITYSLLEDYGLELEARGNSPATRNRKMSLIHTAMSHAQRRGEYEVLPQFPHYAENNVKERYLSVDEERKLETSMAGNAAPADEAAQYLLHAVPFLLDTGIRASELLMQREQDLGDRIWLRHGTTKNGRGRTVPLTSRARADLTFLLSSPYHWQLVALYDRDPTLPTARLSAAFKRAVAAAGIKGVTLHTLRHTCASRLVQGGMSLYAVKEWLGHSSITVTERYAHLAPKSLDSGVLVLEQVQQTAPAAVERVADRPANATVN
jgi:integrase